jgi:hypothetical protein
MSDNSLHSATCRKPPPSPILPLSLSAFPRISATTASFSSSLPPLQCSLANSLHAQSHAHMRDETKHHLETPLHTRARKKYPRRRMKNNILEHAVLARLGREFSGPEVNDRSIIRGRRRRGTERWKKGKGFLHAGYFW